MKPKCKAGVPTRPELGGVICAWLWTLEVRDREAVVIGQNIRHPPATRMVPKGRVKPTHPPTSPLDEAKDGVCSGDSDRDCPEHLVTPPTSTQDTRRSLLSGPQQPSLSKTDTPKLQPLLLARVVSLEAHFTLLRTPKDNAQPCAPPQRIGEETQAK